ncbi:MAG: Ig-like domain-containing protein, partial [Patescibacteria group bacterium]
MKRETLHKLAIGNWRRRAAGSRFAGLALACAALFFALPLATHAQELGNFGLEYVTSIGLPTQDVRVLVARIIRTALGLLGLVAVVIVLYGGFVWMTAGGDESKITQAKQIIVNGVIGLAIIVSAFAIASFVIRSLVSATLEGGPGGPGGPGGGPGGGGLPAGAFVVQSISPSGTLLIRNVVVRATLSSAVNAATVPGNFSVTRDGAAVAGDATVSGGEIRFEPSAACPPPNEDRRCFDADVEFVVLLTTGIRSNDNRPLSCGGFAPNCEARFVTGTLVDTQAPEVAITSPDPGESVSVDALIAVSADATDDAGISKIDFFADGGTTGMAPPANTSAPPGETPQTYVGSVFWNTSAELNSPVSLGSHTLTARAYDVDSNNATSAGVTVMVRAAHCFDSTQNLDETGLNCGGADCGACEGGSCASASQCASGVCEGGVCVNVPRIDYVSPGNGAPGNYITIGGAFFGATPGTVTFADDRVAPLATCATAWSNNQIVVAVPEGAVFSGAISVTVGDQSDSTNDDRGPLIDNFVVNTTLRPGICEIVPTSGMAGDGVTINGVQFGDAPGAATIGGRSIEPGWGATQITGVVPLSAPGTYGAQVTVGTENSNPVNFTVLSEEAATTPRIDYLDPSSGPPTQYVSIFGANFGSTPGTVLFRLPGEPPTPPTDALALTDFPPACGDNFWRDSVIVVKVPLRYPDDMNILPAPHTILVRRADGMEASAAAPFGVNSNPTVPGVCAISPTGGPVGTSVMISGERFGITGEVRFYQDVTTPSEDVFAWGDEEVRANVPDRAATGPVKVVIGPDAASNGVNFQVGACTQEPNSCSDGAECCGDGTCRLDGCAPIATAGGYVWRISTGAIPVIPRVDEEQNCVGVPQSPSPWRNSTDGCVNANIAATFTVAMNPVTLNDGTIVLERCESADTFDAAACDTENPLRGSIVVNSDRFVFDPDDDLVPSTWYRMTLRSSVGALGASILSEDGLYLDGDNDGEEGGDYVSKFRTRASADPCALDHVEVTPAFATLAARDATKAYRADPTAGNCNVLACAGYTWSWTAGGDATAATIGPPPPATCNATAVAVRETLPNNPFVITASALASAEGVTKSDTGDLVIDFANPRVVRAWPTCQIACVNATVGAEFNTAMDERSIMRNLAIYRCANESCRMFDPTAALAKHVVATVSPETGTGVVEVRVATDLELEPDSYYRAILYGKHTTGAGGEDGAQSMSEVYLTDLNYGDNAYSWTFRTRTDPAPCAIERVTVTPPTATLSYVGAIQSYLSTAYGGADECDPSGQQLLGTDYDWSWQLSTVEPTASAVVAALAPPGAAPFGVNVLPLTGTVGCSSTCLKLGSVAGVSVCGNGIVERGEDCDGGSGCSSSNCLHLGSAPLACGNGTLQAGEDCDDGGPNGRRGKCSNDSTKICSELTAATDCPAAGAACVFNGDGCSAACLNEGALPGISICGNGDRGDGEDCDDGNANSGDGCSADCLNEGTGPAPAGGVCGDGVVGPAESCDDGTSENGDGCSAVCLNEGVNPGPEPWRIPGVSGVCGNGVLQRNVATRVGEECDDGNADSGDGCSNRCLLEGSSLRYITPSLCGDGVVRNGEACEFGSPDSRIDPVQYARARLRGTVTVGGTVTVPGTTEQVSDEATLTVLCVCTSAASCTAWPVPPGYGCGTDKCCSPRPVVEAVVPVALATEVCRNTAISARFSTVMDRASLVGNVLLAKLKPFGGQCPPGKDIAWSIDLCASDTQVAITSEDASENGVAKTTVRLSPVTALDAGTRYYVAIRAGEDGVKGSRGVSMAGWSYKWSFWTGADICRLSEVAVEPDDWGFTTANNDATDDDPTLAGFDEAADRDKVFTATAFTVRSGMTEEEIVSTSNYPFSWRWATSDDTVVAIASPPGASPSQSQVIGNAQPKNGAVSLTARAEVTGGVDAGLVVSADAALTVLLCDNPWPGRDPTGEWNPWRDISDPPTNFELSYCRDRDGDDLPALKGATDAQEPTVVPTPAAGVFKEFLLRNPGDALHPTNDAIGIRVVRNDNHLAPLTWYREQGFTGSPSGATVDGYEALRD